MYRQNLNFIYIDNSFLEYKNYIYICYIGGMRILERLRRDMSQKRLGNTGLDGQFTKILFK